MIVDLSRVAIFFRHWHVYAYIRRPILVALGAMRWQDLLHDIAGHTGKYYQMALLTVVVRLQA